MFGSLVGTSAKHAEAAAGKLRRDTPSPASPVNTAPVENTSLVCVGRELYHVVLECGSKIEPLQAFPVQQFCNVQGFFQRETVKASDFQGIK